MNIQYFCPGWGSEQLSWMSFLQQVKDAGYDGIECAIARQTSTAELDKVWTLADQFGLQIIAQHYDTTESEFNKHLDQYALWLEKLKTYPMVKLNSQTGKDHFGFEQNRALILLAQEFCDSYNIPLVHETHRGKFSFAAHVTQTYLTALPQLRLTLDASHWVNVAESYLEDQPEAMALAISRTDHIHARIGHSEGPQVPDPRMPDWQAALEAHLNWWDQIVAKQQPLTITPEFGPFPYMVNVPGTGQPIADQWAINVWMMNLLKERYA